MATQKFDKKAYKKMLEELSIKQQGVREGIEAGKQLTIRGGGGGNVPGEDGPYRKPPPSETPPYPPKPELANFLAPSGTGKTLSEEAYWDGLQTIMETTEAGSNEQNKRLNILMHQFQDQVKKPQNDLKIAELDPLSDYDLTEKGLYMNYMGDMFMNLDGFLFPMGQGYDEGTHGKLVPKGLVKNNAADGLKIAQNKTPSQQNATNMRELIKKLTKEGKHIEAQALYREQFPRA